jgi:hypothetical protein
MERSGFPRYTSDLRGVDISVSGIYLGHFPDNFAIYFKNGVNQLRNFHVPLYSTAATLYSAVIRWGTWAMVLVSSMVIENR